MLRKCVWGLVALFPLLLLAQFGASLQGTITDPSGGVIPNASVTLTNDETQKKLTATASGEGFYRFTGLAPGSYTLSAASPNFNRQVLKNIAIQAEQSQGADVDRKSVV